MKSLLSMLSLLLLSAAASAQAQPAPELQFRHFPVRITNQNSGRTMDVENADTAVGTRIQQYQRYDQANQTFLLKWLGGSEYMLRSGLREPRYVGVDGDNVVLQEQNPSPAQSFTIRWVGGGFYEIVSKDRDRCLGVPGARTEDGVDLQAMACNQGAHQRWSIEIASYHALQLQAVHSDLCLDVGNASHSPSAPVSQYECLGQDNQRWYASPAATGFDQSIWVKLKAKHSGQCLEVGASGAFQNTCSYQYWKLVTRADGFVQLVDVYSGYCLGIPGGSLTPALAERVSCGGTNSAFSWVP